MRVSIISAISILVLLTGCKTIDGGLFTTTSYTTIESDPAGAQVTVEGYGECETPCTIDHDVDRLVTLAKAGYKPQRFVIKPGSKLVRAKLEPATSTDGVSTTQLPDL